MSLSLLHEVRPNFSPSDNHGFQSEPRATPPKGRALEWNKFFARVFFWTLKCLAFWLFVCVVLASFSTQGNLGVIYMGGIIVVAFLVTWPFGLLTALCALLTKEYAQPGHLQSSDQERSQG